MLDKHRALFALCLRKQMKTMLSCSRALVCLVCANKCKQAKRNVGDRFVCIVCALFAQTDENNHELFACFGLSCLRKQLEMIRDLLNGHAQTGRNIICANRPKHCLREQRAHDATLCALPCESNVTHRACVVIVHGACNSQRACIFFASHDV